MTLSPLSPTQFPPWRREPVDSATLWNLVRAGTSGDDEIARVVDRAGLDAVVSALLDEVLFRCAAPQNTTEVDIRLDLVHGAGGRSVVLRLLAGRPIAVVDAAGATVRRHTRMSVAALLRRMFGTEDLRTNDFHDEFLPTRPADLSELPAIMPATAQAAGALMQGFTSRRPDLGELSVRLGSDKFASFHWYTPHYEHHFARYRNRPVRVLEIGIGGYEQDLGGPSLRMWKRYFHRGLVYGLDIFDKSALNENRLTALTGDQSDPTALIEIAERHGPFDIVIDDGSHDNEHVLVSFDTLFPLLAPEGLYVIEDMQTAYNPRFGGTATTVAGRGTSIGLLKSLIDDLHHKEHLVPDPIRTVTRDHVVGISIYHNIAFVQKGVNGEGSLPRWMDDEAWMALGAIPPGTDRECDDVDESSGAGTPGMERR